MNKTIQEVIDDINGMDFVESFKEDVIEAFGDYTFNGSSIVYLSPSDANGVDYEASVDDINAPIVNIKVNNDHIEAWQKLF